MRMIGIILIAVLTVAPPVAGARGDAMTAAQILQRVSATYQQLKAYHIVANRTTYVAASGSAYVPAPSSLTLNLAVELPANVHLEYNRGRKIEIVGNGSTTWRYIPGEHEYTKDRVATNVEAEADAVSKGGETDLLTFANDLLVARYASIARYAREASRERDKTIKFSGRKVRCYVIRINVPHGQHALWIDKDNFLVLRHDESDENGGPAGRIYNYSQKIKAFDTGGPLGKDLFTFVPPNGTRQVSSLGLPGVGTHLIGSPAPDFQLKDADGNTISLSDYRGKVVLIDFWASWCPPCRKELPEISQLYSAYRTKGLVVIGIDHEGKGTVRHFSNKKGLTFTTLIDSDRKVAADYGAAAIPDVFVIDASGLVRAHLLGAHSEKDLMAAVHSAGLSVSN